MRPFPAMLRRNKHGRGPELMDTLAAATFGVLAASKPS